MNKVTLKDIANEVGVSITTVSNVLNNKNITSYSEKRKQQILKIAEALNYEPNLAAKALATQQPNMMAVLLPHYTYGSLQECPFYFYLISGIKNGAHARGLDIIIRFIKANETVEALVAWARGRCLHGIVSVGEISKCLILGLNKLNMPIALVDNYTAFKLKNIHYINTMDEYGGLIAARHLLEQGYKHLCILTSSITEETVDYYRYRGFKKGVQQAGYEESLIVVSTTNYQEGFDISYEVKSMGIDGAFCTSDSLALGLIDGLRSLGVQVPTDLGVIGFDNMSRSRENWLPLTTINQNVIKKGELAVDTLYNHESWGSQAKVSVNLIKRATT
ncbi:LacI family DNA-binding transcriptional regulator [Vallitalea pronyensis]|uniref:LacI family DNA-binding transcriptional regulator n=1 Tax=Vallitalea pronyensis TaxID=1348613 RepID=A0A8J8MGI0_9FIRM|nr:LacI family DNA-binding transcriptional regulator [Vallitalea pronyensis]QUI21174.1 LacI family DNA-binding transcriptional regulator [Vallitalea pronyensis]